MGRLGPLMSVQMASISGHPMALHSAIIQRSWPAQRNGTALPSLAEALTVLLFFSFTTATAANRINLLHGAFRVQMISITKGFCLALDMRILRCFV